MASSTQLKESLVAAIDEIRSATAARTISAIVRGDEVMMAHHDTVVEADDHVILFMADRRQIDAVERFVSRWLRVHAFA